MKLNLRQVASSEAPVELHQDVDVSQIVKGRTDISGVNLLQTNLKAQSVGGGVVLVTGHLSTMLSMSCSRCLKPATYDVHIEFAERFKQGDEADSSNLDDDDIQIVPEERVDLLPYIEESFLLNLPFTVLCNDNCKGLCSSCGTNLNTSQCGCDTEVIDPRLADLKDFFKK